MTTSTTSLIVISCVLLASSCKSLEHDPMQSQSAYASSNTCKADDAEKAMPQPGAQKDQSIALPLTPKEGTKESPPPLTPPPLTPKTHQAEDQASNHQDGTVQMPLTPKPNAPEESTKSSNAASAQTPSSPVPPPPPPATPPPDFPLQGVVVKDGQVLVSVVIDTNREHIRYLEGTAMLRMQALLRKKYPGLPAQFNVPNRLVRKVFDDDSGFYLLERAFKKDLLEKLSSCAIENSNSP